jgi:hypothetical protein
MRSSTLPFLVAALVLSGASSAFADDPTVTFYTTDEAYGVVGGSYGHQTAQPGDDIYQGGDYATGNVYVGETVVGSGPLNGYYGAPNASASAFARGNYSGSARAYVTWTITGTLGLIPTVASGIPVLLNGEAYLDAQSDTTVIPNTAVPASFSGASAQIYLSGGASQNFNCGGLYEGLEPQSCGLNEISDNFHLTPSMTTSGLYTGFVQIRTEADVNEALDPNSYGSPTDDYDKRSYALVDPTVTIDSAFYALYPDAKLTFSPLVGNNGNPNGLPIPSAAPEPATWTLMIAGVGLAGAGLRRRRFTAG